MPSSRLALGLTTALIALVTLGAGNALAAPPANDPFAGSSSIDSAGNNGDIVQISTNVDATREIAGGEQAPIVGANPIPTFDNTIWHNWTAPVSGTVSIDTCATTGVDAVLSLYTGSALNSLTKVTGDVDGGCPGALLPAKMTATVTAGVLYRIRIAGYQLGDVGAINLKIRTVPYSASPPTLTGTPTVGQDLSTNGGTWFGAMPQDKVYTWLSCTDTTVGSCTPISTFAQAGYTLQAADVGTYIRVSVAPTNSVGSAPVAGVSGPVGPIAPLPPSNDDISDATDLGGSADVFQIATNLGATFEAGEPMPISGVTSSINSVWFKWTAPTSGPALFSTCPTGVTFDGVMAIYTASGSGFGALSKVGEDDDGCGLDSRMPTKRLKVTAGTSYWIQMASYSASTALGVPGPFTLTIALGPPNDDLADAIDLGNGNGVTADGSLYNATREGGEPDPVDSENIHTAWFRWSAPVSGDARFDTCSSTPSFDGVMAVYSSSGAGFPSLSQIGSDGEGCGGIGSMPALTIPVTEGTTYLIQVAKLNNSFGFGPPGPITLKIGTRPINLTPAQVSGSTVVGQTLSSAAGSWAGLQPLEFARQWERCADASGTGCVDIAGATGSSYSLTAADQGSFIRTSELATNALGAAPARIRSNSLGPVTAPLVDPLSIALPTQKASKLKVKVKNTGLTLPKVSVTCASYAAAACTGRVKITVKTRRKTIRLGTFKLSFAKGSSGPIKLKLSKTSVKKLMGVKNGAASAVLAISAPGFAKQSATVKFTLSG
ncbi:MAG: hypothetical protein JHD02_08220 [Thermoleophilaceae bacterium]|nr:hypothetical protein [Thermoleophilaceae bacterium]